MGQPIVHFEVIGRDPARLRVYYGELFGWEYDTSASVVEEVSEAGNYGFVDAATPGGSVGIPAGVGGGWDTTPTPSCTSACPTSRPRWRRPKRSVALA